MTRIRCRFRSISAALAGLLSAPGLLTACSEIFPYRSGAALDARATAGRDGRADAAQADGAWIDGQLTFDGQPQDQAAPPDGARPGDGAADASLPDAGADGPAPSGACSALAAASVPWKPDMVLCATFATTNQCAASQYCGAGWHLCTASEYLMRGGKAEPTPDARRYWLAACVKQDDTPTAPRDGVCGGGCTGKPSSSTLLSWLCAAQPGSDSSLNGAFVGVHTSGACRRVGEDVASSEAYWQPNNEVAQINGSACCQ